MSDVTDVISKEYGYSFVYYDIPEFISEMNRCCTCDEPLYPLLDFFNQSYGKIAAMELKRYNNDRYRGARKQSCNGRCDPSLKEIVGYMMTYLLKSGFIQTASISFAI